MWLQFVLLNCLILGVVEEAPTLCEGAPASAVIVYVSFLFVFKCYVRSEMRKREIIPCSQILEGVEGFEELFDFLLPLLCNT